MSTLNRSPSNEETRHQSYTVTFILFPEVVKDKIDTNKFLIASRGVIKLIDKFGKLFAPVKYDMQGNIEKLNARYLSDKECNSTLQDMVLLEIAIGESIVAHNAVLWLTRGLHMIQLFFEKVFEDYGNNKRGEDLVAVLKKSYEQSLEPYHDWMAKQLFGLLARMVPSRSSILQTLFGETKPKDEKLHRVMQDFLKTLKNNVMAVFSFYEDYCLYTDKD